ncbi:uncharacterized protein LOC127123202 [Lathyrus oleraceus]|uniref:uncharacterized protein LOC127123202 n=1 Tax=Pisum sativum TaxID=3888 RepID=UPI0021CF73CD|nr:uncharacterized protein LOC127123202 [Pisum sativum]
MVENGQEVSLPTTNSIVNIADITKVTPNGRVFGPVFLKEVIEDVSVGKKVDIPTISPFSAPMCQYGESNKLKSNDDDEVANQLTRLCNFLGAPARQMAQAVRQVVPVQMEIGAAEDERVHEGKIIRPLQNQGVESGVAGRNQMVMVNRHQDADQIVDQHRQEDLAVENNLITIVERIMARNGMGATLQRPLYASPLAEFILQAEVPRGMKVPKYTKFGEESGESTIEHVARYLTESLKARCFTQVPEHELVQMAAGGLDYSIRKKIDPNFVKSMSQLVDRARHLERLRVEKVRHNKSKKEKVAFVEYDATDPICEADYASSAELEINVVELKPGSAYEC